MAVTNTLYTANSYQIQISNELTGSNNVIDGVNTAITTLGWSLFDSVNQTAYSPIVTRVYRVANADGNSFKYAVLRYDTLKLRINLSCVESWNTTSKVATNESWHNSGCFSHGYDLRYGSIFINATARHLLLQTWILNEPGHWAGIFEVERVAAEDIAANSAPNYFYTNSLMLGTPFGIEGNRFSNTSQVMVAFPRTPDNQVDYFGASVYAPTTSRGMWPPYYPSGNTANIGMNSVYSIANTDLNNLHLGSWWLNIGAGAQAQTNSSSISVYGGTWGWDNTEIPISPVSIDAIRKHMPFGRIYDMGVTRPIGNQLETTFFSANTNGGWPETGAGTSNTEFLLMPFNGGLEQYLSNNYANTLITTVPPLQQLGINVVQSNNINTVFSTLQVVGNNVWAAANNGIWVWNQTAGQNTGANLVYFNSNSVLDIMFDGQRSIYGTINTGLIQIDTETLATNTITSSNLALQNGTSYLSMDNKYIYAVGRNANTQPYCHVIHRSNNTVLANTIIPASSVALNVASGWNTPMPDYKGFVYLSNSPGTTASQQKRMMVANVELGGIGVANTTQPYYTTAAHAATYEYDNIWLEPFSNRLYHFQIASSAGFVQEYINDQTNWFAQVANTAQLSIGFFVQAGPQSQMGYFHQSIPGGAGTAGVQDYRGDLNIAQHRGMFILQTKFPGRNLNTGVTLFVSRFVLHHPAPNPSNTNKAAGLVSRIFDAGNVASSLLFSAAGTDIKYPSNYIYTNGTRVFQQYYISNSQVSIQVQNNYFPNYAVGGYPTARLLIKA
jgi:hypothetical protein